MTLFKRFSLALAVIPVVVACGGGDDDDATGDAPAGTEAESTETDGTTAKESGSGAVEGSMPVADDARAAWTEEDVTRLASSPIDGYEAFEPSVYGTSATVVHERETLQATVRFAACDPFICYDFTTEPTPEQIESAKAILAPVHIENPDLVFEIDTVELAPGYTGRSIYRQSFVEDGGSRSTTHAYSALYTDGANLIEITVNPGGDAAFPESLTELQASMSVDDGATAAGDIFAVFVDEFGPNS
jgi:hypothetical protein